MLRLTDQQTQDFKELANIGSGYAASQLADLLGQRCLIGIPELYALNGQTLKDLSGQQDDFAVAVDVKARGDFESSMYIIMKAFSAERVVREMAKTESRKTGNLIDLRREFALKRLGEKLVQGYMEAVDNFLQVKSVMSHPELTVDLYDKALDRALRRLLQLDGEQVIVQTTFAAPDGSFDGSFALILNRVAQFTIITKLGQMTSSY
jgi:chemotaxis protein CheC